MAAVAESWSVRRRAERRRTVPSRVYVELTTSADGITQSFLIMPGTKTTAVLRGYHEAHGGFRIASIPVTISAHITQENP